MTWETSFWTFFKWKSGHCYKSKLSRQICKNFVQVLWWSDPLMLTLRTLDPSKCFKYKQSLHNHVGFIILRKSEKNIKNECTNTYHNVFIKSGLGISLPPPPILNLYLKYKLRIQREKTIQIIPVGFSDVIVFFTYSVVFVFY